MWFFKGKACQKGEFWETKSTSNGLQFVVFVVGLVNVNL